MVRTQASARFEFRPPPAGVEADGTTMTRRGCAHLLSLIPREGASARRSPGFRGRSGQPEFPGRVALDRLRRVDPSWAAPGPSGRETLFLEETGAPPPDPRMQLRLSPMCPVRSVTHVPGCTDTRPAGGVGVHSHRFPIRRAWNTVNTATADEPAACRPNRGRRRESPKTVECGPTSGGR